MVESRQLLRRIAAAIRLAFRFRWTLPVCPSCGRRYGDTLEAHLEQWDCE